jgi:hypothetical protein
MTFVGYRTYMVAAAMLGLSVAMAMGITIPEEVWGILTALGLGFLRAAVDNSKAEVKTEVKELK